VLLEARQLYCERDERVLFTRLSLSLQEGELLQIEGPNGAGKTTLLRALSGLNRHVEGEILWRGKPLADDRAAFFAECLVLGHQTGIKMALSARENLHWIASVRTGQSPRSGDISQALEAVGLAAHAEQSCGSLSAGQKRRVALARLWLEPARLWVLDEPFSAIDRQGVRVLEDVIASHVVRGGAALVVTHHDMQLSSIPHRRLQLGLDRKGGWRVA
jgi:heme exporter protein A